MKKTTILLSLILASNIIAAENKVAITPTGVVEKKSFAETISFRPYAGGFASLKEGEDTFNFNHGSVGLELSVPIYRNTVDLALDAVGIDSISADPVIDRVGVGLNINFPIKRSKLSLYVQGGGGFWFKEELLDVMVRGGAKYKFTKQFGFFSDVGAGVLLQDGNAYQQLRGGLDFSF